MFVKWPGGKNKLYLNNPDIFPSSFNKYLEPFLGGGSIFFHLSPEEAILGDVNERLISLFQSVKNDYKKIFYEVEELISTHSSDQYYKIRKIFNSSNSKPEHFLYLNWNKSFFYF